MAFQFPRICSLFLYIIYIQLNKKKELIPTFTLSLTVSALRCGYLCGYWMPTCSLLYPLLKIF